MTNKCTIISQIITLLHVSTLLCHAQRVHSQYLAKLHKYVKCNYWQYNLQFKIISYRFYAAEISAFKSLKYQNCPIYNKMAKIILSLQFLWNIYILFVVALILVTRWVLSLSVCRAPWGWHNSVETCSSSIITCEIIVHLLVIVQNNKSCTVQRIETNVKIKKTEDSCCLLSARYLSTVLKVYGENKIVF